MSSEQPKQIRIALDENKSVSGLFQSANDAKACLVLAHGAGAGMEHPLLVELARGLFARRIATVRFQFPFMEQKSRRPDSSKVAQATIRAAVAEAQRLAPSLPIFGGGKSFGGRMTSQAQAECALPGVRGLIFLGFPLHPTGKPGTERANHLEHVAVHMLFLQGTRDALANLDLLRPVIAKLGSRATLKLFQDADHSFHVPARTGKTDPEIRAEIVDAIADWVQSLSEETGPG